MKYYGHIPYKGLVEVSEQPKDKRFTSCHNFIDYYQEEQ